MKKDEVPPETKAELPPPISPPSNPEVRPSNKNFNGNKDDHEHEATNVDVTSPDENVDEEEEDEADDDEDEDDEDDDNDEVKSASCSSDSGNERVREKLKKTSIANVRSATQDESMSESPVASQVAQDKISGTNFSATQDEHMSGSPAVSETDQDMAGDKEEESRPRARKRSFDETDVDIEIAEGPEKERMARRHRAHERKRSREINPEEMAKTKAAKALSGVKTPPTHPEEDEDVASGNKHTITSPRKFERKRSRDRLDDKELEEDQKKKISKMEEEQRKADAAEGTTSVSISTVMSTNGKHSTSTGSAAARSGVEKGTEAEKIPLGSGFANTSAKSPFATAASGSKPLFGSGAGFSSSAFGAMSGSSVSPFGTLGAKSGSSSPFGAPSSSFGNKPATSFSSGFGTGYGPSGFGALASKSDVISSAPKVTKPIAGGAKKPFGARDEDDEDEDDNSESDADEEKTEEPEERKEQFVEQEVLTGEEDEITIFKTFAKIFSFDKINKTWKERGHGTLKLNKTNPRPEDDFGLEGNSDFGVGGEVDKSPRKKSARLIMRAEGTYTVVLNVKVYKGMKVGDGEGNPPTSNHVSFIAMEASGPVTTIVRCKSVTNARELHKHILDLQKELFN